MTTHELAERLLRLPDVTVYRLERQRKGEPLTLPVLDLSAWSVRGDARDDAEAPAVDDDTPGVVSRWVID